MRSLLAAAAAAIVALATPAITMAQAYPSKTVRIVVPWPPGGLTDSLTRLVAGKLAEKWGQQVIVENRAGANGIIGADAVAKAAPDGYTLVTGNPETQVINRFLVAKIPYDGTRDFAPVVLMVTQPFLLVANPSLPARSVAELVALARSRPGAIRYGSWGRGSTSHLGMLMFSGSAGVEMLHVPYKGAAPAFTDLIGGQIDVMLAGAGSIPHVNSGKMIGLAVTGRTRSAALPALPTIAESGFAQFEMLTWYGLSAPRGTPPAIIAKINADVREVLRMPDVAKTLRSRNVDIVGSTVAEFERFHEAEAAKWARVTADAGIKPE